MLRLSYVVLIVVCVGISASLATAQNTEANKFFGKGVHEYFAGNFDNAVGFFDRVEKLGTDDPRVFYFRGLANVGLVQKEKAKADFEKGAALEHARPNLRSEINDSLERVQGKMRLQLEVVRASQLAKLKKMQIRKMNAKTGSPFDSLEIGSAELGQGNPNLVDSSKLNDPTSPFPGLKPKQKVALRDKKAEPKDVFGKKDRLKVDSTKPVNTAAKKTEAKAAPEKVEKKTDDRKDNPFAKKKENPFKK